MFEKKDYEEAVNTVISECVKSLNSIDYTEIDAYLDVILKADKVFFVGVGRVLLALKCIAKRYSHLGIHSVIVGEITEPAITEHDVLVVGSGSGETLFPVGIAKKAKTLGAKIVHIGSNTESSLKTVADVFVHIPVESKANAAGEIKSSQPMTSLFEQSLFLFGDITAMMIVKEKNLEIKSLWQFHANLE